MIPRALAALLLVAVAQPFLAVPQSPLDRGYQQLYNLQFSAAHATFSAWSAAHPADPLGPASEATADLFADMDRLQILQAQFFTSDHDFLAGPRGTPDPAFEAALARAESLAAQAPASDLNALYAQALCHGLRSDYYGLILKRYLASLGEMKKGEQAAQRLLARDPHYADAYLAIGIENYILGLKPAPVRWLLRLDGASTNKDEGLRQLRLTATQGHYLRPYAQILLALAALRDHDPSTARSLLSGLAAEFPLNPLFPQELARLGDPITYTLDPAATTIAFSLGAFLHTVHGSFTLTRGQIQFDPSTGAASGLILIRALSGQSGNADRDRDMQLKVLESPQFPDITFVPASFTGTRLYGVLHLHGSEHPLALPVELHADADHFTATTQIALPYVAWGMKDPSNALLRVSKSVSLTIHTAGSLH